MKEKLFSIWKFIKDVVNSWGEDDIPRLGAALSFYTIFSITPILIIVIAVIGFFYNPNEASGEVFLQIKELAGKDAANLIQNTFKNANASNAGLTATIISFITLIIGATALLEQLQNSLNTIYKVRRRKGRGILGIIKDRLIQFSLIIIFGFFIILFLVTGSVLSLLDNFIDERLSFILSAINFSFSFVITSLLFAMLYKILPDIHLAWKDVWIGSIVTTILFILGKQLITMYLGQTSYTSIYGAAGSLAVFLMWVFYSSQVLFLGAEFTYVYAIQKGKGVRPDKDAVAVKFVKEQST
ncbi:MAG: YihY/virulence factor BrkB family protein [Ignavibacteriales bacterium]|nr:MAG: YihY/virulence factor BrkB family protein [Ignavibacteriales bacterium]